MEVDLVARFRCKAGKRTSVQQLLDEYARGVIASPGTLRFETYFELDDPHSVVVVERYADEEAFGSHLADPANSVFNARLNPLIEGSGSELSFLTRMSGAPC